METTPPPADTTPPTSFARLPRSQQLETLVRASKLAPDTPSLQLLIARLSNELPSQILEELLSSLTQQNRGHDTISRKDTGAITLLAERLAARDPEKTVALGASYKCAEVVEAGLNVLLSRNVAEALKARAGLPNDININLADAYQRGLLTLGGSFSDAVQAIQSQPGLLENIAAKNSWDIPQIIGALAAKNASTSPAQTLAEIRAAAAECIESNPKRERAISDPELAKQRDALIRRIAGSAVNALRLDSPPAASRLFEALQDNEKNVWSFSIEATSRYKESGSEAAISFAESQSSQENMSSAASGVWWALAQQDRSAALAWIESLPAGAFREGILRSVMMDAWNRSNSWGDPEVATSAAASLLSRASQVDYYAAMLSDRHFSPDDGRSRAELIAALPLTPQERSALEQRLAPLKPR